MDLIGYYPKLARKGLFRGIDLAALAKVLWNLEAMRSEGPLPELKFRASTRRAGISGRAWRNRLVVSLADTDANDVIEVLLHELVHCACPKGEHHGELFQRRLIACAREAFGLTLDTGFLLDIEIGNHSKRAYAIDSAIRKAMESEHVATRLRDNPKLRFESPPAETEEQVAERRSAARAALVDERAAHASKMLAMWERKEKRAKNLAAKWRKKVRRYETNTRRAQ
ncbi:MAG TPA: hypothetical protein VFA98_06230 [Thermoanaerobaculia bacterium]|nr:hypothetical protein [Thermoanaerobaculia bacterium]